MQAVRYCAQRSVCVFLLFCVLVRWSGLPVVHEPGKQPCRRATLTWKEGFCARRLVHPRRRVARAAKLQRDTTPWKQMGVLPWLTGKDDPSFRDSYFGRQWTLHRGSARVRFSINESLGLLNELREGTLPACPDGHSNIHHSQSYLGGKGDMDFASCVRLARASNVHLVATLPKEKSDARRVQSASMSRADGWTIKDSLDCAGVCAMLNQRNLSCNSELAEHGDAWTFILNGVQAANDCLRSLHHSLWAALCLDTQINAYLSAPAAQGLNIHSDPHDVFVLQVEGKKHWHILEGEALSMQSFTLSPGDILYMPAGLLHFAESLDMSSLHITIGVRRESWTASALLAAWIEIDPSVSLSHGKLSNDTMHKIKLLHQRVSKHFFPWDACNQMLATSLTVPLLRALDEADLPRGLAEGMTMTLAHLALELALKLRESGDEDMGIAAKLEDLSSKQDPQALLHVVFALREFRWKQHYEFNNAKKLQFQGTLPELRGSSRLKRCADASAQLSTTGLLLNGYHILDISEPALPIFRYCMGMHTGAAGEEFRVCEIPGPRELVTAVVRILLRFDGLEHLSEKGARNRPLHCSIGSKCTRSGAVWAGVVRIQSSVQGFVIADEREFLCCSFLSCSTCLGLSMCKPRPALNQH